jgi:hypothetical protein
VGVLAGFIGPFLEVGLSSKILFFEFT